MTGTMALEISAWAAPRGWIIIAKDRWRQRERAGASLAGRYPDPCEEQRRPETLLEAVVIAQGEAAHGARVPRGTGGAPYEATVRHGGLDALRFRPALRQL